MSENTGGSLGWLLGIFRKLGRLAVGILVAVLIVYAFFGFLRTGPEDVRGAIQDATAHLFAMTADLEGGERGEEALADDIRRLAQPGLPGFLYLEAPQVYTRERLVNDRFRQANWLAAELERTADNDFRRQLELASIASQAHRQRKLDLVATGSEPSLDEGDKPMTPSDEVALDQLKTFSRLVAYREQVRNELMDTLLDDGHDLEGKTLYRLNFDATVVPFAGRPSPGASAVFLVEAKKPGSTDPALLDDLELLRAWERELQTFLGKVLYFRTETIMQDGGLDNPTDPKEALAFDWFLRLRVLESFLDVIATVFEPKFNCSETLPSFRCFEQEIKLREEWDMNVSFRREVAANFMGLTYSADEPSPALRNIRDQRRFRNAIRRVQNIEEVRAALALKPIRPACAEFRSDGFLRPLTREMDPNCEWSKDPTGQRALIRLISVLDELAVVVADTGGIDRQILCAEKGDEQALRCKAKSRLQVTFGDIEDIVPGDIALRAHQFGQTQPAGQRWASKGEEEGERVIARLRDAAQSLFFSYSEPNAAQRIFADFMIERLQKDYVPGYRPEEPVGKFLSVTTEGCGLTACRIAVRPRQNITRAEIGAARFDGKSPLNEEAECLKALVEGGFLSEEQWEGKPLRKVKQLPVNNKEDSEKWIDDIMSLIEDMKPAAGQAHPAEAFAACRLRRMLDKQQYGVAVYSVTPRKVSEVRELAESHERRAALAGGGSVGAMGPLARLITEEGTTALSVEAEPYVLGFSQLTEAPEPPHDPSEGGGRGGAAETEDANGTDENDLETSEFEKAVFGWVVRPQSVRPGDLRFPATHHRLSAVLAVPSWWKSVQIAVRACWIRPVELREYRRQILENPLGICPHPPESQQVSNISQQKRNEEANTTSLANDSQENQDKAASEKPILKRTYDVRLPRQASEVTERFKFEVVKHPYFDFEWKWKMSQRGRGQEAVRLELEVGRSGRLVLIGERLWRGTLVTIDNQPADSVLVLPDMRGIIAEFDCVEPPADRWFVERSPAQGDAQLFGRSIDSSAQRAGALLDPTRQTSMDFLGQRRSRTTHSSSSTPVFESDAVSGGRAATAFVTVWTAEGRTEPLPVLLYPFKARLQHEMPCFESTSPRQMSAATDVQDSTEAESQDD